MMVMKVVSTKNLTMNTTNNDQMSYDDYDDAVDEEFDPEHDQ